MELGIRVLDLGSERCMARTIGLRGSVVAVVLSQGFNAGVAGGGVRLGFG